MADPASIYKSYHAGPDFDEETYTATLPDGSVIGFYNYEYYRGSPGNHYDPPEGPEVTISEAFWVFKAPAQAPSRQRPRRIAKKIKARNNQVHYKTWQTEVDLTEEELDTIHDDFHDDLLDAIHDIMSTWREEDIENGCDEF